MNNIDNKTESEKPQLFKYPKTLHAPAPFWCPPNIVEPAPFWGELINKEVFITEKLDGSNLGIRKHKGKLLLQSRNQFMSTGGYFKGLSDWLLRKEESLLNMQDNHILFGEWLGSNNKISYSQKLLPDLFMGFSVLDQETEEFLPLLETYRWFERLGIEYIPTIHEGNLTDDFDDLKCFFGILLEMKSIYCNDYLEGIVIRPLKGRTRRTNEGYKKTINEYFVKILRKNYLKDIEGSSGIDETEYLMQGENGKRLTESLEDPEYTTFGSVKELMEDLNDE